MTLPNCENVHTALDNNDDNLIHRVYSFVDVPPHLTAETTVSFAQPEEYYFTGQTLSALCAPKKDQFWLATNLSTQLTLDSPAARFVLDAGASTP